MKLETTSELGSDEEIFSRRNSCSIIISPNEFESKHNGGQDQTKRTLECYKNCLEQNKFKYGVNLFLEKINVRNQLENKKQL